MSGKRKCKKQAITAKAPMALPKHRGEKGLLVVISGPSGAGKGTVCGHVKKHLPELKVSVSETTRAPREGEIDGVSYTFVSKAVFEDRIGQAHYLEYAQVYENYYGTPKESVEKLRNQGYDVILEIDTQGAANVRNNCDDGIFIFILPPSVDELKRRLSGRGTETEEQMTLRLSSAVDEMRKAPEYDYIVINDESLEAAREVEAIMAAEHARSKRLAPIVEEIIGGK